MAGCRPMGMKHQTGQQHSQQKMAKAGLLVVSPGKEKALRTTVVPILQANMQS